MQPLRWLLMIWPRLVSIGSQQPASRFPPWLALLPKGSAAATFRESLHFLSTNRQKFHLHLPASRKASLLAHCFQSARGHVAHDAGQDLLIYQHLSAGSSHLLPS
jgi:hypothetical protein